MKHDPLHYVGTKKNCNRVLDKWNVYILKLNSSDPNIWVFYVGVTEHSIEERVKTHMTGGPNKHWGCPYVKERGVENILWSLSFTYKKKGTSYRAIEKVEAEVARRLCERLRQVQEVNPKICFLVTGPKGFGKYLTDEEILKRAQKQKAC